MPEARPPRLRRTKAPLNPKPPTNPDVPEEVSHLAAELGLALEGLLSWKLYASGKVVLIAPNGMKITRDVSECKPRSNNEPAEEVFRTTMEVVKSDLERGEQ